MLGMSDNIPSFSGLTLFPPSEAGRITGLTTGQQANLRRRGHLPPRSGSTHTRFDALALAELTVMAMLADRGIGPAKSKHVAGSCAARIVGHALLWRSAWLGDPESIPGDGWKAKAIWLRDQLTTIPDQRFLIWGDVAGHPDGWTCFTNDPMRYLDGSADGPRLSASVSLILDLEAIGWELLDRAGRPLARVDAAQ